jgi:hypothetical protein
MLTRPSARAAASVLAYVLITAFLGRGVLAGLGTSVIHDPGDPLLTAAILHWNAHHLPLTSGWWQFPSFYPTADTLTFSEHLLGLSVVAAPLDWLIGNALATHNLVVLLTFPLCAAAMYALVFRLTRSAAAAFIAGLVFAFAPYRISQLPHVQMLATFWAPLALLGLHGYTESRRVQWLALYGGAWMLQGAANGYALVFFSIVVALWVLWFVGARRDWKALLAIGVTTAIACLPLVPIIYKYMAVHSFHGFERSAEEMRVFSANVAALLCAPSDLTFWGWLRVSCRQEGELFPGGAVAALCAAMVVVSLRRDHLPTVRTPPAYSGLRVVLAAVAAVYGVSLFALLAFGPWRLDLGFARASASSADKPLLLFLASLFLVVITSPRVVAAARQSSLTGFYLCTACLTWFLALGPLITLSNVPTGVEGPFAWLMWLPGMTALRVPARFWLVTSLCLAVSVGMAVARLLEGRGHRARAAATAMLALLVLTDGWVGQFRTEGAPQPIHRPTTDGVALSLPIGIPADDIAAQWRAVLGGWKTLNGYSGWRPAHYIPLTRALVERDDETLTALRRMTPLYVDVSADNGDGWRGWLTTRADRPSLVTVSAGRAVYRFDAIPSRPATAPQRSVPFTVAYSSCDLAQAAFVNDGAYDTAWVCDGIGLGIVLDLHRMARVSGVGHALGSLPHLAPRGSRVEVSLDGATWRDVWSGSMLAETVRAAIQDPRRVELQIPFAPTSARFVRLTQIDDEPDLPWSIAELRVLEAP